MAPTLSSVASWTRGGPTCRRLGATGLFGCDRERPLARVDRTELPWPSIFETATSARHTSYRAPFGDLGHLRVFGGRYCWRAASRCCTRQHGPFPVIAWHYDGSIRRSTRTCSSSPSSPKINRSLFSIVFAVVGSTLTENSIPTRSSFPDRSFGRTLVPSRC